MSNKIVPTIYRAVIDDVISTIKPEFDEFGVTEEVLAELQHKWENKVIASHVAEFETPPQPQVPSATHPVAPQQHHFPSHPMHMMQNHYGATHNPYGSTVKSEPVDSRYMLNPGMPYSLPPLPGPNINGSRALPVSLPHPGGQTGIISFPRNVPQTASAASTSARPYPQPTQRIPQLDGPSDSSGEEDSPSPTPGAFAPRTAHPSLPQPHVPSQSHPTSLDSEAINSDLDDSDTENEDDEEGGNAGETDIVFCTYDKVARVKNKWKCTLKDGMIHVNGKDYLFAKCTGEFEW